MKSITNILVPTDFSATAKNAFDYAQKLAEVFDAHVTVAHIEPTHSSASEITIPMYDQNNKAYIRKSMDQFIEEGTSPNAHVLTQVKTKIIRGTTVSVLVEMSHSKAFDLIVMGMTGLQDLIDKIIGSASLEVSSQAACPVLLIPRDTRWKHIKRVVFAVDRTTTTHKMVRESLNWAHSLDAELHFVHIGERPQGDLLLSQTIWDELFSDDAPPVDFKMKTIYSSNTVEELNRYSDENNIDCLIFVSRKRSFWQNIMHYSISQNVALNSTKPILVIHLDDLN